MAVRACLDGLLWDHERLLLPDQPERGYGGHGGGGGGGGRECDGKFIYV